MKVALPLFLEGNVITMIHFMVQATKVTGGVQGKVLQAIQITAVFEYCSMLIEVFVGITILATVEGR